MIDFIIKVANHVAWSANNNALFAVLTVYCFWVAFNFLEGFIEKLFWGESFEHILDVFFTAGFIGFSFVVVYRCAINNFAGTQ